MNFLAHLFLAGNDEELRLGAMMGDFVRGPVGDSSVPQAARRGILLHRHIDQHIDALPEVALLREEFSPPFRRYSGIIIDLAFDHELALHWLEYSSVSLEVFDQDVRSMLSTHEEVLPDELRRFMRYADTRGLFAAYVDEEEILFSLRGVGRRVSRANPLHRVGEIWQDIQPAIKQGFGTVFPLVQREVSDWLQQTSRENLAESSG